VQGLDISYQAFNDHLANYALDWIGAAAETVFGVNSVVINPNLVMTTGEPDKDTQIWLKKHDIDFIAIPLRTRSFWDSGVSCLTVDSCREGEQIDYFPDRESGLE
jgi:hypothetical protein